MSNDVYFSHINTGEHAWLFARSPNENKLDIYYSENSGNNHDGYLSDNNGDNPDGFYFYQDNHINHVREREHHGPRNYKDNKP